MNDGHINASMDIDNASLDVTFGEVYEIDKGMPAAIIANLYNSESTYSPGDYVIYRNRLYKCLVAIETPEEFDIEKWELVKVAEELKEKADKSIVYTKIETNALLDEKANANNVYTKTETDALLDKKANADNVYTKAESDTLLGEKADLQSTLAALSSLSDAINTKADAAGTTAALALKADKTYVDTELGKKANTSYVDTELDKKADKSSTYTKTEVDTALASKATADSVYTKMETDEKISDATKAIDANFALEFNPDWTYEGGEFCIYEGRFKRCINGYNEPKSFDENDWVDVEVGQLIWGTEATISDGLNGKMDKSNPTGTGRIAVGQGVVASGAGSQAFGVSSTASGLFSHAEGFATTASGESSHAEGYLTTASGQYSHAEGGQTIASGRYQHVSGKYNVADNNNTYVEIIGNGGNSYARSNARTLDWQGNETLAGDLTINGNQSVSGEITRLDGRIDNLPEAMVFKGTLGVNGDIQTLPTASAEIEGWTFKCITAGTYAGLTLKVGDTVTCFNPPNTSVYEWDISGYGDTDTDTWRAIKVNGVEKLGNGISSGAVDFVGSDNIEVEFDANGNKVGVKTKNIYTKTEVDSIVSDAIYNVLPDDTASGSVANFNTSLELPLKSLEIDVNAVQASGTPTPATPLLISGWSEIKDVHCGANLWNEVVELGALDSDGTLNGQTTRITTDFIPVKPNQTYRQSSISVAYGGRICFYDKNKSCVRYDGNGVRESTKTFTTQDGEYYVRITLGYQYGTTYNNDISINYPSSDTEYHAYNPNGTTEVINLGGTYYGGHFTQDKNGNRQFEVTHKAKVKLRDVGYWNYSSSGNRFYVNNISDVLQKTDWNNHIGLCDCYVEGKVGNNQGDDFAFGFYNASLYLRDSNYSDVTTWLNAVGDYYITYQLATPFIIDLPDGEPIITLNGTNNIYADTGDCAVEYKVSIEDYVGKRIANVQALTLNT